MKLDYSLNDINKIFEEIKKQHTFNYSINKMKQLKEILLKLEKLEPNNEFIKKIIKDYEELMIFLKKHSKIRISTLGLYSSGKSTILNYIIGKNILPTSEDECTKRSVIIRYHDKDEPELYKTAFKKKSDYYYFEDGEKPICFGTEEIKNKLKLLNETEINFEESFYLLKIKIKLFDDFKFDKNLKSKIELIDFPGLHTKNNFYEKDIFNPLMKFCDGFIFLNKNDLINDKSNVDSLREIILRIESKKLFFNLNSCLFILNNFGEDYLNIFKAKINLEQIIFGKIKESGFWNIFKFQKYQKSNLNINLVEFNAGFYERCIKFYEEISDFKHFILKCKENKEEDEQERDEDNNVYKSSFGEYIKKNYISYYEQIKLSAHMTERSNELLSELKKLLVITIYL